MKKASCEDSISVGDIVWVKHPIQKSKILTGKVMKINDLNTQIQHKDGSTRTYPNGNVSNDYENLNPKPYKRPRKNMMEGSSKRDQQDVDTIRAAIERLQAQLSHPNADRAAIQQSIEHERKRLALYGQGVVEESPKNALGKALYRDLSKEKKTSPAQVEKNKARWALRQAEREQGVAEDYNAEYDDEAGMADNNLETLARAVEGIDDLINSGDNLPEWCQEKIAVAKSTLVSVWDYMKSEENSEQGLSEDWQKVNKKDKTDGMSTKAVKAYRKENPGSKLKTAVTKKPSELKAGSKDANRRKSFCARMGGAKKNASAETRNNPDSPVNKALRRWNCESVEQLEQLVMLAEQHIRKHKKLK